jgi:hypothetical protein
MDADVYGPSIPHLLGLEGRPEIVDGKIQPIKSGEMPVMSMGFLIGKDQAVVWRGPMLHGSITQFLRDTAWGELDYLIIDMPPGTGDVALTLSQLLPLSGVAIVCTPQEVALLDAGKAIAMFEKTNVPVLGVVENMSGFTDPESGKTFDIFGKGGARSKAEELGVPFLGEVPIQIKLRSESDEGRLADVIQDPMIAKPFENICRGLVRSLVSQIASRSSISAPLPILSHLSPPNHRRGRLRSRFAINIGRTNTYTAGEMATPIKQVASTKCGFIQIALGKNANAPIRPSPEISVSSCLLGWCTNENQSNPIQNASNKPTKPQQR